MGVPLLNPDHPELSQHLVHLTGRSRGTNAVDPGIRQMTAEQRLAAILQSGTLRAFPPYGGSSPVVSFSECGADGTAYMISDMGFEPWGIIVPRQFVYDAGGNPVMHVRPEHSDLSSWPEPLRSLAVRLEAGSSDWLGEREWRVPCASAQPGLSIAGAVSGIIVAEPHWKTGGSWAPGLPQAPAAVPRYWWNRHERRLVFTGNLLVLTP